MYAIYSRHTLPHGWTTQMRMRSCIAQADQILTEAEAYVHDTMEPEEE
jgi:hypothetical protein